MTLIVLAMGVVIAQQTSLIRATDQWNEHSYEVLDQGDAMLADMINQETGMRGFLLSNNKGFLDPYREGRRGFDESWAKIKSLTADNPAQQTRLEELRRFATTWQQDIAERQIALMGDPATVEKARGLEASGAGKVSMDAFRQKLSEIEHVEIELLDKRKADLSSALDVAGRAVWIGTSLCIVSGLAFGLLLFAGIAAPIRRMTEVMGVLATGNTAIEIPDRGRKDEIGAMAAAVQVFKTNGEEVDRLRVEQERQKQRAAEEQKQALNALANTFEARVMEVVKVVASSSTELQATAQSMSSGATQTAAQATTVAAAAEQTTANVQMVASAADELSSSISEISRQVTEAAQMSTAASDEAARTNAMVQSLSAAADRIGEVVKLINDIASQTNLLALNATIEAARAGDAGKGFAVVAGEVKHLANQTARATDEISQQISAVQEETRKTVEAIRGIGATIDQVRQISAAIASAVEEQGTATKEIARNVEQAAQGTQEVSRTIGGITESTSSAVAGSEQVLASASDLAGNSEKLRAEVAGFLSEVRAA
ncbi:MAG TPA: CHASE3 domain-containing protein [Magnetospirillaceae bacterium]|nr:CHASE3 domain-containing protein [Magnetospirillaceae bacterium]